MNCFYLVSSNPEILRCPLFLLQLNSSQLKWLKCHSIGCWRCDWKYWCRAARHTALASGTLWHSLGSAWATSIAHLPLACSSRPDFEWSGFALVTFALAHSRSSRADSVHRPWPPFPLRVFWSPFTPVVGSLDILQAHHALSTRVSPSLRLWSLCSYLAGGYL